MAEDILLSVKVTGTETQGFFRSLASGANQAAQSIHTVGPAFSGMGQQAAQAFIQQERARAAATAGITQHTRQLAALRAEAVQGRQALVQLGQGAKEGLGGIQLLQQGLGALGIATGLTAVLALVKSIAQEGIRYNAVLETQKIGLASIITSQQRIQDAQGRTLEGAEKFSAAQILASGLMKQIQKDALLTTATTEQLVDAFSSSLGPLGAAGLSLEQSQKAVLRIVQAASALGIPMHQVNQEVRAIAEGSIDVNARLAKALGITNEMVKSAKEQGRLYDFILEKMQSFALAGDVTQQSFAGLSSALSEILTTLSAKVVADPFERIKSLMGDSLNILLKINEQLDVAATKPLPGSGGVSQASPQVVTPSLNAEQVEEQATRIRAALADIDAKAQAVGNALNRLSAIASDVGGVIHGVFTVAFAELTDRTILDGLREIRDSFADTFQNIREGLSRAEDAGEGLKEQTKGFVTQFAEVRDASKVTWRPMGQDMYYAAAAADALGQAIDKFSTKAPDLGPTVEQIKAITQASREATDAVDKLHETAARQAGDVGAFRRAQEESLAHDLTAALVKAQQEGVTDLTDIYAKFDARRRQNELAYTGFVIEQGKKQSDAALAAVDTRLSAQRSANDVTLSALSKEIEQLQALQEQAERAGTPLSAQGDLLAQLNQKQATFHQTALRAGQAELALLRERLGVLEKTRSALQAQAGALQGKQDIVSLAQLKQLNDAIKETTKRVQDQRNEINQAQAAIGGVQADIQTTEIERGEAQVALTQKYLEEEEKRTQFTQDQAQRRADIETLSIQQRIDALQGQQSLEAATIRLREAQGAGLQELADREEHLIVLEQRRAQESIRLAEVQLDLTQRQLADQQKLVDLFNQGFQAKITAGDFEGAKTVAGYLSEAAGKAVELSQNVDKAKASVENAKASFVTLGVEGQASVAKINQELQKMRSVFDESDARGLFSDLLDADSLKDAGRILERESKNISKRTFEALLFGKRDNFDAPLIENVNGLFGVGDGGLLGQTMQAGGQQQGTMWGNAVTGSAGQTMTSQFPQIASQSLAATEGIFAQKGTSAGTVFGNNALSSFKDVFGDGIGGVLDGIFRLFSSGGSGGGGQGSGGGVDVGGLFNMFKGLFGGAGETSATSFNSGFIGNFGQGFGDLSSTVDANSVDWQLAGSQGGSQFGGGFLSGLKSIFGGGGGGGAGGGGGGLMGLFSGSGGAGGASGGGGFMSWFGLGQVGAQIGSDFSKGNYGAGAGGVVGGALGAYFSMGNPQITAAAAQIGAAIGGIFDKIFNQQGRIDKEKGKIIKYFERVFDIDFKKITEKQAAKGLAEFADAAPAAKALGAIFSEGLKKGDVQGSTIRFAGQLLGNLRKMGDGADEVKDKLLELADAANFDLHDSIAQINAFTKETGADALNLKNFQEEVKEARKNLKEYGDTSTLTAAQLTDLAAAHGNTGSQIVTYTTLIGGAIDIGTRFNEFLDGQQIAQQLAAQSFLDAAEAAGSTGQSIEDLADKIRTGNLSLEEATIALNEMREAAGLAKLSLDDVTIDPEKIQLIVDVLQSATEGLQNFSANLTDMLASGIEQGLDPATAGERFDEFFDATLRTAITKAIIGGLIDGLAVEALAPFFTALGAEFTNLVTGAIDVDEFGRRIAAIRTQFQPQIDAARAGFVTVNTAIHDTLTDLGLWPEAVGETNDSLEETRAKIKEIQDRVKAIDDQLFEIARKRIRVDIDLAANLEKIGAITLKEKLEIEAEGLQQEFDLLTQRLRDMGEAASLSVEQLQEAVDLVHEMAANVVARFQAEKQAIEDALKTEIDAIRARGEAEADRIRAAFAAQRAAIEARIDGLEKEKDRIQEVFDLRREALEKELELAREFQQVAQNIQQTINNLATSNVAPISPFGQLSFLQRQAAQVRGQLETAKPEDIPELMERLSQLLQQMAQLQTPNTRPSPEFQRLFTSILTELEALKAEAERRGANADSLEEQLKALDIERNEALKAIDAQIEAARAQLDALSAQEQAALDAAAARVEQEIKAAQDRADAKIDELRTAAEAELRRLAEIEKDLLSRQEQVLLTEKDVLLAQLSELQKLNITAADLLRITTTDRQTPRGSGNQTNPNAPPSPVPPGSNFGFTGPADTWNIKPDLNESNRHLTSIEASGHYDNRTGEAIASGNAAGFTRIGDGVEAHRASNEAADAAQLTATTTLGDAHSQLLAELGLKVSDTGGKVEISLAEANAHLAAILARLNALPTTPTPPPPTPTTTQQHQQGQQQAALSPVPSFLADTMRAAVYAPPRTQDLARPERVQSAPRQTSGTPESPREVKLSVEIKANVEVTGTNSVEDAAAKFTKSVKTMLEPELRKFIKSDFASVTMRDTARQVVREGR